MNGHICNLAQSLKKIQLGKTRSRSYKNFGRVIVSKTEDLTEVKFDGGLVIQSCNPIWELYLAEALLSPDQEHSKAMLKYVASDCFVEREEGRVKASDKNFFISCLFQHKNPLLSVVLGDEVDAKDV